MVAPKKSSWGKKIRVSKSKLLFVVSLSAGFAVILLAVSHHFYQSVDVILIGNGIDVQTSTKNLSALRSLFASDNNALAISQEGGKESAIEKDDRRRSYNGKIAYAISITDCPDDLAQAFGFVDAPAVLAHSIHLNSWRNYESGSKYDYQLYAFVHPDATNCIDHLARFKFIVKVLETPINVSQIKNEGYRTRVQEKSAGCCKEKEFLKLYSLTLDTHEIVVHLDMDTLLLKPLDVLFDAMMLPDEQPKHIGSHAMWEADRIVSRRIESFFTRDYPMGNRRWPIEHFGVQGGFWIVRPNREAYDELRYLIIEGNFSFGWYDGDVHYPGFYGAAMIQGLLAFYYGHLHPGVAIELNRCQFNNMADNPVLEKYCVVPYQGPETDPSQCEDCRKTNYGQIYSLHTTFCAKSWLCAWHYSATNEQMCDKFYSSWYQTRYHLETAVWGLEHSLVGLSPEDRKYYGYCNGARYTPINISGIR